MSHDIEASYASMELAKHVLAFPEYYFDTVPEAGTLSCYAGRESKGEWPHADGVIDLMIADGGASKEYKIAVEFKRPNEGLHGVLTAIGQTHAYLSKGYSGSVMIIPDSYSGLKDVGGYVNNVLNETSQTNQIAVVSYLKPDLSRVSPFEDRLIAHRRINLHNNKRKTSSVNNGRTETQWAHLREGSSDPDAFFKYLQCIKFVSGLDVEGSFSIPVELSDAVVRLGSKYSAEKFISNSPNDSLADKAWRKFWFENILNRKTIAGWNFADGVFCPNPTESLILRPDGGRKFFFVGRKDSIKNKICDQLNSSSISLDQAWELLAKNYNSRAHSYREDVDSGCEHLGFIDSQGRLTDLGYKYVDACERFGNPNEGIPRSIFISAVLKEGALGAFLHYIYRISEERFKSNPLSFSVPRKNSDVRNFDSDSYLKWVEGELVNRLHVMRKVSARGGSARKPFQAELAVLRSLKIISDFRVGVGLEINWYNFQQSLEFNL